MQAQLSAIAYIFGALALAVLLTRVAAPQTWYRSGMTVWFASAVVILTLRDSVGLSLALLAATLLVTTPRPNEQKLPYCLLIFCAVPYFVSAPVPFPFINYLISVNFQVLVGALAVFPALLGGRKPEETEPQPMGWGVLFMIAYFAITTLLMFRVLPFTSMFRYGVESVFGIVLIYLFILRSAISEKVLEQAMKALYVVAVIFASIALLSQFKHWNFYSHADAVSGGAGAFEVRYGVLRTSATVIPVLFGFLEAVGFILLLRHRELSGRLPALGLLVGSILILGSVVSMSRGAWLSGVVAVGAYYLFRSRLSSSSIVFIIVTCVSVVAFTSFAGDGFSTDLDPFGTFDYRRELFIASWAQFQSAPFIGTPDYLNSGRFDGLVTGLGIVDIVSVYLQIALQFGLVGLLLYIAPYLIALQGILKLRSRSVELDLQSRTLIAGLGAFLLGYIAMMFTVSGVSLVIHYGVIFVALANAAVVGINLRLAAPRNEKIVLTRKTSPRNSANKTH